MARTFLNSLAIPASTVVTTDIADNAVTLAKLAGGTDGNIISFDASGNPVAIATGSDGQLLTSTGAGSPPAFEAAAAGGSWTFINSQTVSNVASVEFKHGTNGVVLDNTYIIYKIVATDIEVATDNSHANIHLSTDAGSSYITSGYDTMSYRLRSDGSTNLTETGSAMKLDSLGNVVATEGGDFIFTIFNPSNTKYTRYSFEGTHMDGSARAEYSSGGGILETAGDVDAIKCLQSSGNILTGTYKLYGLLGA